MSQLELDMNKIQERENACKKLEHDINDVNIIFKDLAVIVHDQGEIVNSIEANIEQVQSRVQTATQNLQSAQRNQVSNKCFAFLSFIKLSNLDHLKNQIFFFFKIT
jgi:syntaxin 12/13